MKLTKTLAALLAGLTVFTMAACGKQDDTQADGADTQQGQTTEQTTEQTDGKKEQIVFGTSADYAPFEFHTMQNGSDTIVGADIQLAQKIADDMGKELVIKDISFDILLNELQNGTIDFVVAAMAATDERKEQADPSQPYYEEDFQRVVFLKSNADKYTDFNSFEGAKVAVQSGSIQVAMAEENLTGCEILVLQSVPDMFNNLMNGKCDAVLVDGNVAEGYVAANSDLALLDQDFPVSEGSCVWVQKGDPQGLLESINKTIGEVTENGLMSQWLSEAAEISEN